MIDNPMFYHSAPTPIGDKYWDNYPNIPTSMIFFAQLNAEE